MSARPAPAAGVVFVRDAPDFQALMLERAAHMRFAAGALAFPGGRIAPSDGDPAWREMALGLPAAEGVATAAVAALRETFEETGVLNAVDADDRPPTANRLAFMAARRASIAADADRFSRSLAEAGLRLDARGLRPFARWVGPPGAARRFDALFFIAPAPVDQAPSPDGVETAQALWIAPATAAADAISGRRRIIHPTLCKLQLLALSETSASAIDAAARRPVRPIEAWTERRDGVDYVCIPDDLGYPTTAAPVDDAARS